MRTESMRRERKGLEGRERWERREDRGGIDKKTLENQRKMPRTVKYKAACCRAVYGLVTWTI